MEKTGEVRSYLFSVISHMSLIGLEVTRVTCMCTVGLPIDTGWYKQHSVVGPALIE